MKYGTLLLLTVVLFATAFLPFFLHWWVLALLFFIFGVLAKWKTWTVFGLSFIATAALIFILSWLHVAGSQSDLPKRMSQMFSLPHVSLIYLVAPVLFGLIAALAAASGSLLASLRE